MENNNKKKSLVAGIVLVVLGALLVIIGFMLFIIDGFSFDSDYTGVLAGVSLFAVGSFVLAIGIALSAKKFGIGKIFHDTQTIIQSKMEVAKLETQNQLTQLQNQPQKSTTCAGCGASKKGDGQCPYCGRK